MKSIVIDTNVIIAAFKSNRGASYKLLTLIGDNRFRLNISVPLLCEYEAVIKRTFTKMTVADVDNILDYFCSVSNHRKIYYLWRPFLKDAQDDMVLELACAASADYILTYNLKDFIGCEKHHVTAITPQKFLCIIGEIT